MAEERYRRRVEGKGMREQEGGGRRARLPENRVAEPPPCSRNAYFFLAAFLAAGFFAAAFFGAAFFAAAFFGAAFFFAVAMPFLLLQLAARLTVTPHDQRGKWERRGTEAVNVMLVDASQGVFESGSKSHRGC